MENTLKDVLVSIFVLELISLAISTFLNQGYAIPSLITLNNLGNSMQNAVAVISQAVNQCTTSNCGLVQLAINLGSILLNLILLLLIGIAIILFMIFVVVPSLLGQINILGLGQIITLGVAIVNLIAVIYGFIMIRKVFSGSK